MTRNKYTILLAFVICWVGAILCSLILTYGPHGPARHPKMLLIGLMPVAMISMGALLQKHASRPVILAQAALWVIAIVSAVTVINSSIGDSLHPITMTVILACGGAISLGILSQARIEDPVAEPEATVD